MNTATLAAPSDDVLESAEPAAALAPLPVAQTEHEWLQFSYQEVGEAMQFWAEDASDKAQTRPGQSHGPSTIKVLELLATMAAQREDFCAVPAGSSMATLLVPGRARLQAQAKATEVSLLSVKLEGDDATDPESSADRPQ